jgi:hypothetical protein
MSAIQAETNATTFPLELTVDQLGVGGVTGLAPTVALRLIEVGTPKYLDWTSMTFKTAGWMVKYQPMTALERGHYQQLLNIEALELAAGDQLSAEYHVDNGAGVVGDDADLITLVEVGQEVDLLRKVATNRLEEAAGNPGILTLFDDDAETPVKSWQLRDANGGAVVATVGSPAKRSAAT